MAPRKQRRAREGAGRLKPVVAPGRGALVTGAGSGIGAACARTLGELGYGVVCADLDLESAARTASSIPTGRAIAVDVASEQEVEAAVSAVLASFGRLDAVVAAAGIHRSGHPTTLPRETFDEVLAVNVTGSFLTARCSARAMRRAASPGSIVLVGSMNSVAISLPGQVAYAASKGGVLMLAKALAVDLAPDAIRVNVVLPGITNTPLSAATLADEELRDRSLANVPLAVPAEPDDIAAAAAFLISPESSLVTGAAVAVDGGQLAMNSGFPWPH